MASPTVDFLVDGDLVMHDHSESDLGAILDPRYLKLDQSAPQTTVGTFTFPSVIATNYLKTPKIYPSADSATAIQILKAGGTTSILNVDTTNSRVGIGTTSPALREHISGTAGAPATTGTSQTGVLRLGSGTGNAVLDMGVISGTGQWLQSTNATDLSLKYPILLNPNGGGVVVGATSIYNTNIALDVYGSTFPVYRAVRTISATADSFYSTNNFVSKATTNAVDGFGGGVVFSMQDDTQTTDSLLGSIGAVRYGADNSGAVVFNTYNAGSFGEKMRILPAGNVGIGTTAPGSKLQVVGSDSLNTSFAGNISGATGTGLVITNAGNVGIGTTSPGAKLDIKSSGTNTVPFQTTSSDGQSMFQVYEGGGTNGILMLYDGSVAEKVRFNSDGTSWINGGNVGVGTTSPTNLLSLGGNSARIFWMERHTTANTAGNTLTITAGGATSGATDKNGGNLLLQGGLSTGTGESGVVLYGCVAGASGTTDRTQTPAFQTLGNKIGFFNVTPVVRATALTTADASALNTGDATSDTVIANMRTRINELESKLQSYGLLS